MRLMYDAAGTPEARVRQVGGRLTAFLASWIAAMAETESGVLDAAGGDDEESGVCLALAAPGRLFPFSPDVGRSRPLSGYEPVRTRLFASAFDWHVQGTFALQDHCN